MFQFNMPGLFHGVLGAGDVVWGLANQWFEDFGKLPGHTIGNRPLV